MGKRKKPVIEEKSVVAEKKVIPASIKSPWSHLPEKKGKQAEKKEKK